MDKLFIQLTNLNQNYNAWVTWGVVLIICFGVLCFIFPVVSQRWKEWRMVRCMNNTGQETLRDVFLSDGMEGVHYFPFIVLTRQAIVFFKTMQFRGIIFAADTIDFWTQVVGKRSYKFHNPMPGLDAEIATIKSIDKKLVVEGRVVFPGDSHFPKGRPEAVILETEVKSFLQEKMQGALPDALLHSWEMLKTATKQVDEDRLLMSKPKALSGFRVRMAWFFSVLGISWLLIRLL